MEERTIYHDNYIRIKVAGNDVCLEMHDKGYNFEQLNSLISKHHEIEITNFANIKKALNDASKAPLVIGRLKERITVDIVNNGLRANITFNLPDEELTIVNREVLVKEIKHKLQEKGISFGVREELFKQELQGGLPYLLAEGVAPENGRDSVIKMFIIPEDKPVAINNGKVDYYEHKLINRVEAGDWLGERIEATEGTPGRTVKNEIIPQVKGKTFNLNYDRNSIGEETAVNVTTLKARISGAVKYIDDRIAILRLLEIEGDVDFKTGNIKFDGFITIKGTIADGFNVEATRDIEIQGIMGIGNVKGVISTEGSILIKGGIASRSGSVIQAKVNVFTKYLENASINCGEIAHIGFYSINSNISAREIIVESGNGHIIGGTVRAKVRITAPVLGTELGKRTVVEIEGFDRKALGEELLKVIEKLGEMKNEQQKAKQLISQMSGKGQIDPLLRKECQNMIYKLTSMKEEMKVLEARKVSLAGYLKARGEGELIVTNKIYPNCQLIICRNIIEITEPSNAAIYYYSSGEIKQA